MQWINALTHCDDTTARATAIFPAGHFAVAGVCTFALNYAYCCTHGKGHHPRYTRDNGLFQLAALTPIIEPADAADERIAEIIATSDQACLKDRDRFAANCAGRGDGWTADDQRDADAPFIERPLARAERPLSPCAHSHSASSAPALCYPFVP